MFSFACVECGSPTHLPEVHSWVYGNSICSAICAAAVERSGRLRARAPSDVIAELTKLLSDTGWLVGRAIGASGSAESTQEMSSMVNSGPGAVVGIATVGLAPFLVVGTALESAADSATDRMQTSLWEVDRGLHQIIARTMELEQLGYPVARELAPMVRFSGLVGANPGGLAAHLRQLYQYLEYLHSGVGSLRPAPRSKPTV